MRTTLGVSLRLKPVSAGVRMSLTGTELEPSEERQRLLMELASRWTSPGVLRVALCADARGYWEWSSPWTAALAAVTGGYEVRFVERGGGRGER